MGQPYVNKACNGYQACRVEGPWASTCVVSHAAASQCLPCRILMDCAACACDCAGLLSFVFGHTEHHVALLEPHKLFIPYVVYTHVAAYRHSLS